MRPTTTPDETSEVDRDAFERSIAIMLRHHERIYRVDFKRQLDEGAKMPFAVHPHMLRHGCGYALANASHDTRALQSWLGHKNIQHTVRYTELAPDRFRDFWR